MSSPIKLDQHTDPRSIHAPIYTAPGARERILSAARPTRRSRASAAAAVEMGSKKYKPKFRGDRAILALQDQLALNPDLIPAPSSERTALIGPILIRVCGVTALAALVAWGLVSYSAVKNTIRIVPADSSRPEIASRDGNAVELKSSQLRPTLSPTKETPVPVARPRPVVVATADTEAVTPLPVTVPAAAETSATAVAPAQAANERRLLQLDSEDIAILVKRGKDLLGDGDLAAARLLLRRAADAGSAEAALTLGTTFDPVMLQRLGAIGAQPDLAKARHWYQRAAELGSSAASQQLAGLTDIR